MGSKDELRDSEAPFRHLADNAPVMVWITEPDGRCSYLSKSWYAFTGQTPERALGFGWLDATHPDDRAEAERRFRAATAGRTPFRMEYRLRQADGSYCWALDAAAPRLDGNGEFLGFIGSVIDISEHRRAKDRLAEREALLSLFIESAPATIAMFDRDMRYVAVSRRFITDYQLPADADLIGRSHYEVFPEISGHWRAIHARVLAGETLSAEADPFPRADGRIDWVRWRMEPWRDAAGRIGGALLFAEVVTAQKNTEAALREALLRFEAARRASRLGIYDHDVATGRLIWDERLRELWGLGADDPVDYDVFLAGLHPDDRAATHAAVAQALTPGGSGEYAAEFRVVGANTHAGAADLRWIAATGQAIFRNGEPVRLIGTVVDVTARRKAEEALAALNADLERRIQERTAQLVQSQKMEAIGQLTGGVAHDFNNLLQGIGSCLHVLRDHVPDGPPRLLYDAALQSIERGGRLTQSLLAFARRQTLAPEPTDLRALLEGMRPLLERTLGGLIRFSIDVAPGAAAAQVDPSQLESAILNLVINARDAMPAGGFLTVRVEDATVGTAAGRADEPGRPAGLAPGDYVTVCVTDTGGGMDPRTLARVFEPFFTTKGVKGSGLGLSMVHGMAAQSGGGVQIASAPGRGTAVTLYLPRAAPSEPAPPPARAGTPNGAAHAILLVDDDAIVRIGIKALLEELGYRVLDAGRGEAALAILRGGAAIDALITDYAMPGMNGVEVLRAARGLIPDLPAMIITGYADVPGFAKDVSVLHKPFMPHELEERVAAMLHEAPSPGPVPS